ncbi:MAG: phosphodiester glycosidase family protein, partial [Anaerolineales bacterium]
MNLRKILILAAMIFIPISTLALTNRTDTLEVDGWEPAVEGIKGIEFQKFRLTNPAPVNVFVARMEIGNPDVIIESSIAQGRISGGVETVSSMADEYDQALNNWPAEFTLPVTNTWGSRNNVVVAINGFYFGGGVELPGVPWSGQIHSGWYAKRYTDFESLSGFVWKMDRNYFIGECVTHPQDKQIVYIADNEGSQYSFEIDGLNRPREDNELILYTSQYDSNTDTNSNGIELLIEMEKPTSITEINDNMPKGFIRQVNDYQGSTPIPFDHVVISANGTTASELRATGIITDGNRIAIAQKVKNCSSSNESNWNYAYAGVGGQFYFLRGGVIFDYSENGQANVRDPRTAIAYNDDHIFFIVADGRNLGGSEGMTVAEMAEFVKNTLKATDGIMQDGGGSSTMVVDGKVVNNTICNEYSCKYHIFLPSLKNTSDSPTSFNQRYQRSVANGMMLVVVEPKEQSQQAYDPFDPVTT